MSELSPEDQELVRTTVERLGDTWRQMKTKKGHEIYYLVGTPYAVVREGVGPWEVQKTVSSSLALIARLQSVFITKEEAMMEVHERIAKEQRGETHGQE